MNGALKTGGTDEFRFFRYVAADLRRARVLLYGTADSVTGVKLWSGALSPRFAPVLLCRLAYTCHRMKIGPVGKVFSLLNFFFFGIEIAVRCPIGKGLFFPHTQGTVIGAWAIGTNATIFQGVTLGARELDFSYMQVSRPTLGDNVTIGAGAKVLGAVTLGDGSSVGANAVVVNDVRAGATVVGIPAAEARPKR